MGIKETKELMQGLGMLGEAGLKIAADGKVAIDDLKHLVDLGQNLDKLIEAAKDVDMIDDELKDLDEAEMMELAGEVISLVKKLREAKKSA